MATLRPLRVISTGPSVAREPNSSPKLALASEEVMEREGCMPELCPYWTVWTSCPVESFYSMQLSRSCACHDRAST